MVSDHTTGSWVLRSSHARASLGPPVGALGLSGSTVAVRRNWGVDTAGVFLVVAAFLLLARNSSASQLLAVAASAADTSLSGATVAEPKTPSGAMFANPAALTLFDDLTVDGSFALSPARTEVDASVPPDYDEENSFLILAPGFGFAAQARGPLRFGLGAYGTVGNKFDFDADPAAGVNEGFFSEAGILTFVGAVAYPLSDRLSIGAAVTPLYGRLKMRFALGGLPFKYTLTGFGIQSMFGLRWVPWDGLAIGVGARTPGRVWMDGSTRFGSGRQDVDLELEMPAQIFVGVTKHLGERVRLSVAARWSDTTSFGNSFIEFELTPQVSLPFVPGADDEWLVNGGVEYELSRLVTLRLGVSHANAIVGKKGVSPLLFDADDWRVGAGLGLNLASVTLDLMIGHGFEASRKVDRDEAAVLPGRYTVGGDIVIIGLTWRR